jgi:hypothetical protein
MTEVDQASESAGSGSTREVSTEQPAPDAEAKGEAAATENAVDERALNADGRERPGFLLDFPHDPELDRLVQAFEAGNYEAVRRGAPRLAETTENPVVRSAARELRKRIDPDPLMKYLLWVAIALFVFVVWYTYQNHAR